MNRTILLVDDDIIQLRLFEKLLTSNGYSCRIALSVDEAELILKEETPDLIISDYEMPVRNGFEFRRHLLTEETYKNIPFLFLTSVNDHDFVQQGLDLKAIDYITKNTPPTHVLSKIDNLLQAVREHYERSLGEIKGIAEKLNLRNIPKKAPVLKNFSISYFNQSFQNQPGGDFIDFIKVNDRYTFIVLGDVMGKKWGAWFFSFSFLSYIRSAIRLCVFDENYSLSQIMNKLNRVIYADELLGEIFSTLSIVLVDDELGTIKYAGAGDLPLLKFEKDSEGLKPFKSDGILLGFAEHGNYNEIDIAMGEEEEIYLISDGMIDFEVDGKKRSDLKLFEEKLFNLKKNKVTADEIKNNLFNKHVSQVDDCSIIILKKI
ncbi:PP2C family protein-serine/threonine phosphatase [Pedobacter metabolipauper]|uniref:Sigma-B regulation protein RsbU (Phosphoserine phosphatase) n=1 Tax=Pedobacter metabolipauper TaxID=425513 RepID=A0A4R6T379_9SPHI|nr:response regulator [Pedobacter metabolipauper]TDQ11990.1 sigma-B regulation protein RsbU (phosphoserine phosphatase) [Pedobacter metabolipauper]